MSRVNYRYLGGKKNSKDHYGTDNNLRLILTTTLSMQMKKSSFEPTMQHRVERLHLAYNTSSMDEKKVEGGGG